MVGMVGGGWWWVVAVSGGVGDDGGEPVMAVMTFKEWCC